MCFALLPPFPSLPSPFTCTSLLPLPHLTSTPSSCGRLKVALAAPEPRVHFALVCGAKSCPPIRTYTAAVKRGGVDNNVYDGVGLHGVCVCVCVCACVCVLACVCLCVCISVCKLIYNYWSHHFLQSIDEDLTLTSEAFLEGDGCVVDMSRREVSVGGGA